ncbi:unknown protein [Seminavis robusta]|uniref:Uncharacterized protein n=1 Tax=Seminavis robusta TaxID=568900 RepID=A0A9N8HD84_9STRA|nr:unknown protein [Seminavis robusta]|eukprot:Sro447_g145000.1 n/a (484) ;mRNA; f:58103-59843
MSSSVRKSKKKAAEDSTRESAGFSLFKNMTEAEESVDWVIDIDTDYPESHGHGLSVHCIEQGLLVENASGKVKADTLKIYLENFVDLNDYDHYQGTIVLKGEGFLISKPSTPSYMLNHHQDLHALESEFNQNVADEHSAWITAINKDKSRQTKTILLVMPQGITVTTDMKGLEPKAPDGDLYCKLHLRELQCEDKVEERAVEQLFFPGFWNLRIIEGATEIEKATEQKKSLLSAFEDVPSTAVTTSGGAEPVKSIWGLLSASTTTTPPRPSLPRPIKEESPSPIKQETPSPPRKPAPKPALNLFGSPTNEPKSSTPPSGSLQRTRKNAFKQTVNSEDQRRARDASRRKRGQNKRNTAINRARRQQLADRLAMMKAQNEAELAAAKEIAEGMKSQGGDSEGSQPTAPEGNGDDEAFFDSIEKELTNDVNTSMNTVSSGGYASTSGGVSPSVSVTSNGTVKNEGYKSDEESLVSIQSNDSVFDSN